MLYTRRMLALLYDVHGNCRALEAVLADARGQGADRWLLGGDYCLFGPSRRPTLERLRALSPALWLRGNGERWTADPARRARQPRRPARDRRLPRGARRRAGRRARRARPSRACTRTRATCHASPVSRRALVPPRAGRGRGRAARGRRRAAARLRPHPPAVPADLDDAAGSSSSTRARSASRSTATRAPPTRSSTTTGGVEHRRVAYDHGARARRGCASAGPARRGPTPSRGASSRRGGRLMPTLAELEAHRARRRAAAARRRRPRADRRRARGGRGGGARRAASSTASPPASASSPRVRIDAADAAAAAGEPAALARGRRRARRSTPRSCAAMLLLLASVAAARALGRARRARRAAARRCSSTTSSRSIPSRGSVGSSGDLAPLAHLALVLIGEGEARSTASACPAARRWRAAGPRAGDARRQGGARADQRHAPDGGRRRARRCATRGACSTRPIVAVALSLEAFKGSTVPFDERLHDVRGQPGQARRRRAAAARCSPARPSSPRHADCGRVQDPYTLRCAPQVLGAIADAPGLRRRGARSAS